MTNLPRIRLLFRFDIRKRPEASKQIYPREFFGCGKDTNASNINWQYKQYINLWEDSEKVPLLPLREHFRNSAQFWLTKKYVWPELASWAQKALAFLLSSLSVERFFAQFRVIDSPLRGAMTWKTLQEEGQIHCNMPIVNQLFNENLTKMQAMLHGMDMLDAEGEILVQEEEE